jgi:hypothetical protein
MRPPDEVFRRCSHCSALVREWDASGGNTFGGITIWSDGIAEGPMLRRPDLVGRRCPACHTAVWTRSLARVRYGEDDDYARCAVVLLAIGPNAIAVNRAIRTAIPMTVRDAHTLIHEAPIPLALPRSSAPELVAAVTEAGADAVDMTQPGATRRFDLELLDSAGYAELVASANHELDIRLEWWRFDNEPYRGDRDWHRYADRPANVQDNALRLFELLRSSDDRSSDDRLLAAELARQLERYDDAIALVGTMTDEAAHALADLARARRPELVRLIVSSR